MSMDLAGATHDEPTHGSVLRTIIADDERLARDKLRSLLACEPGIQVVAECSDGEQTLLALRELGADLVILDVQMPSMDGFEMLSQLAPEEIPAIVFATAYDKYALRAFEAHALDYLLKPFDQERLHAALERARMELGRSRDRELTRRLLDLLARVKSEAVLPPSSVGRLVIREKGRIVFLNLDEVEWIEASANYVRLHAGKDSHLFRETISRIAERLNPDHFIRIHRSTIVDVRKIKELIPVNSGEYVVVLKNGKELSCSRGYRAALQDVIQKHS
jgi:two-component system, LytTR family, response regulator